MDIVTHLLTGELMHKVTKMNFVRPAIYIGCVAPDLGEILIQKALSQKFGEKLAVYDDRTSDLGIASNLKITWLYDMLHSPMTALLLVAIGAALTGLQLNKVAGFIYSLAIGVCSHILLDSFTHGKVWALKLMFPFSNRRFPILDTKVGNWWDWQPVFKLPYLDFPLPSICVLIWAVLIAAIYFIKLI